MDLEQRNILERQLVSLRLDFQVISKRNQASSIYIRTLKSMAIKTRNCADKLERIELQMKIGEDNA